MTLLHHRVNNFIHANIHIGKFMFIIYNPESKTVLHASDSQLLETNFCAMLHAAVAYVRHNPETLKHPTDFVYVDAQVTIRENSRVQLTEQMVLGNEPQPSNLFNLSEDDELLYEKIQAFNMLAEHFNTVLLSRNVEVLDSFKYEQAKLILVRSGEVSPLIKKYCVQFELEEEQFAKSVVEKHEAHLAQLLDVDIAKSEYKRIIRNATTVQEIRSKMISLPNTISWIISNTAIKIGNCKLV